MITTICKCGAPNEDGFVYCLPCREKRRAIQRAGDTKRRGGAEARPYNRKAPYKPTHRKARTGFRHLRPSPTTLSLVTTQPINPIAIIAKHFPDYDDVAIGAL